MNTLKFNQLSFNHIGEQKSSVKLQSKTVTFDESDNLEIVPDSGYVGLSKVNVIKDKNDYLYEEYIAPIINNEEMKQLFMLLFTHAELINFEWKEADNVVFKKGNRYICSPKIENIVNLISSLGTCKLLIFPNKVVTLDGQDFILGNVIKSFLAQNNQRYEDFLITKEQFYDLTTE